jgi:hypothetical protein
VRPVLFSEPAKLLWVRKVDDDDDDDNGSYSYGRGRTILKG